MKKLFLFLVITSLHFGTFAQNTSDSDSTSTFYLIRHAEKDRSDKNNKNPHLTEEGKLRAQKWAIVFKEVNFDNIYSTEYMRTIETASPTAKSKGLNIENYDPRNLASEAFMAKTKGKKVLVVGHSNTTPAFVNKLLGDQRFKSIADNNNGSLFIVTISGTTKSVSRLQID